MKRIEAAPRGATLASHPAIGRGLRGEGGKSVGGRSVLDLSSGPRISVDIFFPKPVKSNKASIFSDLHNPSVHVEMPLKADTSAQFRDFSPLDRVRNDRRRMLERNTQAREFPLPDVPEWGMRLRRRVRPEKQEEFELDVLQAVRVIGLYQQAFNLDRQTAELRVLPQMETRMKNLTMVLPAPELAVDAEAAPKQRTQLNPQLIAETHAQILYRLKLKEEEKQLEEKEKKEEEEGGREVVKKTWTQYLFRQWARYTDLARTEQILTAADKVATKVKIMRTALARFSRNYASSAHVIDESFTGEEFVAAIPDLQAHLKSPSIKQQQAIDPDKVTDYTIVRVLNYLRNLTFRNKDHAQEESLKAIKENPAVERVDVVTTEEFGDVQEQAVYGDNRILDPVGKKTKTSVREIVYYRKRTVSVPIAA